MPRVYLPADYKTSRQYMLAAYLYNSRTSAKDVTTTLGSNANTGDTTITLASVGNLPEEGQVSVSFGHGDVETFDYTSRNTSANTVTGLRPLVRNHPSGRSVKSVAGREIIAPIVDLNIEVAFLPNTTGNDLIY